MRIVSAILLAACFGGGFVYRLMQRPAPEQITKQVRDYVGVSRTAEAEELLARLVLHRPSEASTEQRLMLANLANRSQHWDLIVAAVRPIPDSDPYAVSARIAEGDAWRRLHRASQAEECWRKARQLEPGNEHARGGLLYLAAMQLRRGLWREMLWEYYDAGLAGQREMIQLMIAEEVVWESESAAETVAAFARADPGDVHSRRALGVYALHTGDLDKALGVLEPLYREYPDDKEVWFALIDAHNSVGKTTQALELLKQTPDGVDSDYRYWRAKAIAALAGGDSESAVRDFRKAVECFPFDLQTHTKLAQALRFAGDFQEAKKHAAVANRLSALEQHCHNLQSNGWSQQVVMVIIGHCEALQLIEEARGWVDLALQRTPQNQTLLEIAQRLKQAPATSSRNPPNLERFL